MLFLKLYRLNFYIKKIIDLNIYNIKSNIFLKIIYMLFFN